MQSSSSTPHSTCERRREPSLSRSSGWFHRTQLYRVSSTGGFTRRTRSRRVTWRDSRVWAVMVLAIGARVERQQPKRQVHHARRVRICRFLGQHPGESRSQKPSLIHLLLHGVAPV